MPLLLRSRSSRVARQMRGLALRPLRQPLMLMQRPGMAHWHLLVQLLSVALPALGSLFILACPPGPKRLHFGSHFDWVGAAVLYTRLSAFPFTRILYRGVCVAFKVRHSVAIYGQLLLFCDQSMREKAWRSRKHGA